MKRISALILALIMCLSFTACGGDKGKNNKDSSTLTVANVLSTARPKLDQVDSLRADIEIDMSISAGGMSMGTKMDAAVAVDLANKMAHVDMNMSTPGMSQKIVMYMDGEKYYLNLNDIWYYMNGLPQGQFNTTTVYVDDNIKFYYDAIEKAKGSTVTRTQFNGVDCYMLKASVPVDTPEAAAAFNLSSTINQPGADQIMGTLLEAMGKVEIMLYIDCATDLPCGFEVDMVEALNGMYEKLIPGQSIKVDKAHSSAYYYDYNKVSITIPDDARNGATPGLPNM